MSRFLRFMVPVVALGLFLILPTDLHAQGFVCIGGVTGDATDPDMAGCIEIVEFHHLVAGAGATTHEPVVFVKKRNERSTVDLLQLLDSDTLFVAELKFKGGSPPELYYEIRLADAYVAAVEPWWRRGSVVPEQLDRVRLGYDRMNITYFAPLAMGGSAKSEGVTLATSELEGAR